MKRFFAALFAAAVVAAPAASSAQSPLEGHWKRKALEIAIAPCGDKLCGTVVKASEEDRAKALRASGQELIGSRILTNITPAGPGAWHGTAFIADYNTHVRTTLRLTSSDTIDVKGCILLVLCRTKTWERAR